MKKSTRIVGLALAGMMVASTAAVGSVSVSAAKKVNKPKSVKAVNTAKGIKITWKKVKGAKKYQVFRGKKKITTTKKKTYTDKKVKAGKSYKYTVKAVKGKKVSKKSKAAKVVRLTKPVIKSVSNSADGAVIKWKKVKGAKKYYVYRGSKKIATTKGVSYTDKNVVSGKAYSYKVKAVNGKSTSVASAAKKYTFLAAPQNFKYTVDGNKVTFTWDKVEGAERYDALVVSMTGYFSNSVNTAETTATLDLGANPTALTFTVTAKKGDVNSADATLDYVYVPDGCYKTDESGNLHVFLTLEKGEAYAEGALITEKTADYSIEKDSSDAISIDKSGIIYAEKPGKSTITVKLLTADVQSAIYNAVCQNTGKTFGNNLSTGVVYVDVTVTE